MTIGHRTNAIYQDAVTAEHDLEIDMLARAGERLVDRELARTFGGDDLVLHELRRLRVLNAAAEHYDLGAYHNALVHAVVPGQIEALNEAHAIGGELITLCCGRYLVRGIDVGAFIGAFFADTDFALPADVVNALSSGGKSLLGLEDGVFGLANGLVPHRDDLVPRQGRGDAVEAIVELSESHEADLRRRHQAGPDAVWHEVAELGPLYQAGEVFPFWPAWLGQVR
ncbi:MAG: hypothetical protein R3E87_27270 [Burkholderiaceae bacterium]